MEKKFRSSCVIASCLDLIGDKWSLLIIRDMLLAQKKTFKEFATSDEEIATNLLSSRLKMLESLEVITKRKLPANKKENIYLLTEKGLSLAPMILEIVAVGAMATQLELRMPNCLMRARRLSQSKVEDILTSK